MKKTVVLPFALLVFGTIAAYAQNAPATPATPKTPPTPNTESIKKGYSERAAVQKSALPETVKKTLASDEYKGWETGEINWITGPKGDYYEIPLKKGDKNMVVNIDKQGKKVK